jgi:hypothetical protein
LRHEGQQLTNSGERSVKNLLRFNLAARTSTGIQQEKTMQTMKLDNVSDEYQVFVDEISAYFFSAVDRISDLVIKLAATRWQSSLTMNEGEVYLGLQLSGNEPKSAQLAVCQKHVNGTVGVSQADFDYLISKDASFSNHVARWIAEKLIRAAIEHGVLISQ